jgi:hypothetical protein
MVVSCSTVEFDESLHPAWFTLCGCPRRVCQAAADFA